MASEPLKQTTEKCKTEGCNKFVDSRGFCTSCYYRNLRNGELKIGEISKYRKHRLSNINSINKTATCTTCGEVKIIHRGKNKWRCGKESNHRSKLYKRAYRQSKKDMLSNKCEICGSTYKLVWDHCHTTNMFRGTLCSDCNLALGLFKDNQESIRNAILYLKKFQNTITVDSL